MGVLIVWFVSGFVGSMSGIYANWKLGQYSDSSTSDIIGEVTFMVFFLTLFGLFGLLIGLAPLLVEEDG